MMVDDVGVEKKKVFSAERKVSRREGGRTWSELLPACDNAIILALPAEVDLFGNHYSEQLYS